MAKKKKSNRNYEDPMISFHEFDLPRNKKEFKRYLARFEKDYGNDFELKSNYRSGCKYV